MLNKKFRITALFLVLFMVSLNKPNWVLANIGTHLGEGDINGQVAIMDMLAANGAEDNFPVTLMVQTNTSKTDLQKLANAVNRHNYFPIVRVNRACDVNEETARNQVNSIKQIFGSSAVITYGNEVNNPRECNSTDAFRNNYIELDSCNRLSPSALDFYNGDYPATNFLNQTGLASEYSNAPVRTANAYGCTDTDLDGCNPLTTDTVKIGTQLTGDGNAETQFAGNGEQIPRNKLYLTEFSLSPNGENAPDTDLDQVRTFIETRGPQTGAVHITPLIRNVCPNLEDEGQWLLYLHGDFYTTKGTKVTMTNCEALDEDNPYSQTTRDLSRYYLYSLRLQPDKSFNNTGDPKDVYIWNMVVDQGYRVYKPSPQLSLTQMATGNWPAFFEYIERSGIEYHIFSATDGWDIDIENGHVPLFRGTELESKTEKISSLEGYFGSNNLDNDNVVGKGVINNLLDTEQQCLIKIKNLKTIKQMCEKLDDNQTLLEPETCAFHKKISQTEYYLFSTEAGSNAEHLSLLNAVEASGLSCSQLSSFYESSYPIDEQTFLAMQTAINNMDFNLDQAYRWAFLVISPLMNPDGGNQPSSCQIGNGIEPTDNFCYLWRHKGSEDPDVGDDVSEQHWLNRPQHAPIFVAFKIPDFGTHHSDTYDYRDSAQLVASVLLDKKQADLLEEKITEEEVIEEKKSVKSVLLDSINIARTYLNDEVARVGLPIFCTGMPMCDCAHNSCPLQQALVDIINGSSVSRYGYNSEPDPHVIAENAGDIYTLAGAKEDLSRTFSEQYNTPSVFNLASTSSGSKDIWKWGLKVYTDDSKDTHNDQQKTTVGLFVVAPINNQYSTLSYLTEALQIFFEEDQLEKMVENNCIADGEGICGELPKFYPFREATANFKSSNSERFHNPEKIHECPCREVLGLDGEMHRPDDCPDSGREICKNDKAGILEDTQSIGLYYPGATFGWFIRKIQETLHEAGSISHDYIASCERTEDLFLGRCGDKTERYGPDGLPYNGGDVGPGWSAGDCEVLTSGPCSVENLKGKIANWPGNESLSDPEITIRAKQASMICSAESGGNANAINRGCTTGESVDYSVGLFQINLLAHACPHYFEYSWNPPQCTVLVDQSSVDSCAENVMNVDNNIRYALSISGGGQNWGAWATAGEEYCGPSLDAVALD